MCICCDSAWQWQYFLFFDFHGDDDDINPKDNEKENQEIYVNFSLVIHEINIKKGGYKYVL